MHSESKLNDSAHSKQDVPHSLRVPVFDRLPAELVLRILTIGAEDNPIGYASFGAPVTTGRNLAASSPFISVASRVCRRWFFITHPSSPSSQHLWHFCISFTPKRHSDIPMHLRKFRFALAKSQRFDLYINIFPLSKPESFLQAVESVLAALQTVQPYKSRLAFLQLAQCYPYILPFLTGFKDAPRLHTILIDGLVRTRLEDQNARGLAQQYNLEMGDLQSAHLEFAALNRMEFNDSMSRGAIPLGMLFPTGPNLTKMFLYADQGGSVDGKSLVDFLSSNVTLTHLMAFGINSVSLDDEEDGVKWESNLVYLNIKGSAKALFQLFHRFQLNKLREAILELDPPDPTAEYHPEIERHSLPSLRRLAIHKGRCSPSCWVPGITSNSIETTELIGLDVTCSLLPLIPPSRNLVMEYQIFDCSQAMHYLERSVFPDLELTRELYLKIALEPGRRTMLVGGKNHPFQVSAPKLTLLTMSTYNIPRPLDVFIAAFRRFKSPSLKGGWLRYYERRTSEDAGFVLSLRVEGNAFQLSSCDSFWLRVWTVDHIESDQPIGSIVLDITISKHLSSSNPVIDLLMDLVPYRLRFGVWAVLLPQIKALSLRFTSPVASEHLARIGDAFRRLAEKRIHWHLPIGKLSLIDERGTEYFLPEWSRI